MSPELREQYLQNDLAALDAMVQICLRAAHAAVTRIEELTARAPGWTDPREVDCTLPADRMARAIRRCAALKAKLPDLYNKPEKPAASAQAPAPASAQPAPTEPAPENPAPTRPARPRDPDSDPYESLSDPAEPDDLDDDIQDPEDPPLTAADLAGHMQSLAHATATSTPPPTLSPFVWRETIRRTLEPAIDAIGDATLERQTEAALTSFLDHPDFPRFLAENGPVALTEQIRAGLALPRTRDHPARDHPARDHPD